MKSFLLLILLVVVGSLRAESVDLVIFSYNRPMQLYALLESCEKHVFGIEKIHVICRMDDAFISSYNEVWRRFPQAIVHLQGKRPHEDFKSLLLTSVFQPHSAEYVMFAVDDIIVKGRVNLEQCVSMLEQSDAFGFYLRLGKNITYNYNLDCPTPNPPGDEIDSQFFLWKFRDGTGSWRMITSVDMTIFRKRDLVWPLEQIDYMHPTSLETKWIVLFKPLSYRGICYLESKVVNIPLNLVHPSTARHMSGYSAEELLRVFQQGYKIDIRDYEGLQHNSAHTDYKPRFTAR